MFGSPTTAGRPNAGYGGLFWRGPRSFTGGTVITPDGTGGDELMGTRAPWLAFAGRHDERRRASTLVFRDAPANFSYPSQWFVRSTPFAACARRRSSRPSSCWPRAEPHLRYDIAVADGELRAAAVRRAAPSARPATCSAAGAVATYRGPQSSPAAAAFPGRRITVLDVYDWPAPDGLPGGSAHIHLASTEGYVVAVAARAGSRPSAARVRGDAAAPGRLPVVHPGHHPPAGQRRRACGSWSSCRTPACPKQATRADLPARHAGRPGPVPGGGHAGPGPGRRRHGRPGSGRSAGGRTGAAGTWPSRDSWHCATRCWRAGRPPCSRSWTPRSR